ncbi:MAG: hypothetical protein LPK19_00535 [Hymenobacteraceae bacterium]|nr:hypothetical protein [Hymenobacteraceae bacterium]MDX5510685.1 hypothetical protein [Hymenobacteraceae bacterium]
MAFACKVAFFALQFTSFGAILKVEEPKAVFVVFFQKVAEKSPIEPAITLVFTIRGAPACI